MRTKLFSRCLFALLLSLPAITTGQGITVSGKVTTTSGDPLPGVSVTIKNTKTATATDPAGAFSLIAPGPTSTLVFTHIGYLQKELKAGDGALATIILEQDSSNMQDVVVIGYGSVKKSDITGSLVSLKAADLSPGANINVQQMLQGRAAGVQIQQLSGEPGSAMSIKIR